MIICIAEGSLLTKFGTFHERLYYDGQKESIALIMGNLSAKEDVLCRIHSSCISAHIFNSVECDCREQMEISQFLIEQERLGVVIWLDQEGRSNGHMALLRSAPLRALGRSQTDAYVELGYETDARSYKRAAEILRDLGVKSVRLLSNNPDKLNSLAADGIPVSGRVPVQIPADNPVIAKTFEDKRKRGHLLDSKDLGKNNLVNSCGAGLWPALHNAGGTPAPQYENDQLISARLLSRSACSSS